jgi:hypothetical protein
MRGWFHDSCWDCIAEWAIRSGIRHSIHDVKNPGLSGFAHGRRGMFLVCRHQLMGHTMNGKGQFFVWLIIREGWIIDDSQG